MNRLCIRGRVLAAATALFVALGATACDSDDEPTETLASFMGWDDGEDPEAAEARWQEQESQIQEAIRECMAREGFEYIPVEPQTGTFIEGDDDREEYVRTRGFGITTWYGDEMVDDVAEEGDGAWFDPNHDIVEAMSDSEREAYYEALYGSDEEMREHATIEYDEETGEEVGWSLSGYGFGCDGEAREEVWGNQEDNQALWEELEPAFEAMHERVRSDPELIEYQEQWSACMAEAGYDYATQEDMQNEIWEDFDRRLQELLGDGGGWVDPFEGWSEADIEAFFEERTDDEIQAVYEEAERQSQDSIDQDALRALQQEEIDLAVADFECAGGDEYWEIYQRVSERYEADLIAENRDLLERLREAEGR